MMHLQNTQTNNGKKRIQNYAANETWNTILDEMGKL